MMLETPTIEKVEFKGFEEDPFIDKRSYLYGSIQLYAPLGPVAHWPELPWLFQTKHGLDGADSVGLKHIIHAQALHHCLNHASLIGTQHLYAGLLGDLAELG